jgi:hypothetical protein
MWWPLGSQYFIFPTCLEGSSSARGAGCLTMFDITQDIYQHLIYINIYIYVMYIYICNVYIHIYPFRTSKAHNFSCSLKFDEICTFARFGALAKFMRPSRKKARVWTLLSPSLTLRFVAQIALSCGKSCACCAVLCTWLHAKWSCNLPLRSFEIGISSLLAELRNLRTFWQIARVLSI